MSDKLKAVDMVNHPPHYLKGKIETIDLINEIVIGYSEFDSYLVGNVVKYISRSPYKNGLEDLKKAQFYLNKLVNLTEERGDE